MQSKGPCDAQMSWDASKARNLPDTAAGCFRKWSLFGGDAPAFRSSRKNSYCIAGESILRHVGTARRGLGEKCVLPRLDIGCRDHGLNCWNTDCSAGRAVISALTGPFLLCLTVAFFVGRLRWLRLPLSSLLSPFYGWGPGALRVNWYPLGRGLLAFSIFSACRAVAWVFFSLPPAPSPN